MKSQPSQHDLDGLIRNIHDFPVPRVTFFDSTPLLANGAVFRDTIVRMAEPFEGANIDAVLGAEARGFFLAPAIAFQLGVGFVPARKPGKLPFRIRRFKYALRDTHGIVGTKGSPHALATTTYPKAYDFEVHVDGIITGQKVLFVDDLLAKGGTAASCCQMVEEAGATVVACVFLIELIDLKGADQLKPRQVYSLLRY